MSLLARALLLLPLLLWGAEPGVAAVEAPAAGPLEGEAPAVESPRDAARAAQIDLDAPAPRPIEPEITLDQMRYVSSRGPRNDMIVEAGHARVLPEDDTAYLEDVKIQLMGTGAQSGGLELVCDSGIFRFQSGDFEAVGNVHGTTGNGRRFRTHRLFYDHATARVRTREPVVIRDQTGTYRGGGFEYFVEENRFRLLGGASVVQE